MRNEWKMYFIFSQKEQKGLMVLGCILLFSMVLSWLTPNRNREVASEGSNSTYYFKPFEFDPNTIDSANALKLGIPLKQVITLLNYRKKGGHFYRKEQFANLYGLTPTLLDKLMPFIKITTAPYKKNRNTYWDTHKLDPKESWVIDINQAAEKEWIQKTELSKSVISSILHYKNYLGAFDQTRQIKKVYGMSDEAYQLIRSHLTVSASRNVLLNANTMHYKKWEALGLFSHKEIGEIIRRRKQNGGKIGWREIVIMCDLTETQANGLKAKVDIKD